MDVHAPGYSPPKSPMAISSQQASGQSGSGLIATLSSAVQDRESPDRTYFAGRVHKQLRPARGLLFAQCLGSGRGLWRGLISRLSARRKKKRVS